MKRTKIICLICAVMMLFGSVNAFAISLNVIYSGSGTMGLDATETYTDYNGNTVPTMTMTQVSGNYGKLAGDQVYEWKGFSKNNGGASDYIGMWQGNLGKDYVIQTQLCITAQTNMVDYQLGFFYEDGNTTDYSNNNIIRINSEGEAYIFAAAFIDEEQRGDAVATLEKDRWYNIDVVIPTGKNYVTVYVNGEPTVINFNQTVYGIRHFRISTGKGYSGDGSKSTDVPFLAYMDNVGAINTSTYSEDDDKLATLTSAAYKIEDNKITVDTLDVSASEVLENVTADSARIRLYSDAAMTNRITSDEGLSEESVLVVAKLVDGEETSYNYYTFTFPGAESGMYSGTQTLTLTEGGNSTSGTGSTLYPDSTRALTYPTAGTGGKKASDSTYFWGGKTCGSGGHWYMNIGNYSASLPAHIYEITFKLDEGATGFSYGPAPFVKDSTGATTTVFPNTYPFSFTLEDGAYLKATVSDSLKPYSTDGTNNVFAEGSRGIKLGDIEPGKWHTFAMVTYADGTDDFDVYYDGVKIPLNWNFKPGNMRHVRMYAFAAEDQKVYFDNLKSYGVTAEAARAYTGRDAKAAVEFIGYEVKNNVIEDVLYGTTVADIKNSIVTEGNVRVYTDDTYSTLMTDSEEVTENTMVVVAATNSTAYERALSYYKVGVAVDYDELTASTRITDLAVNAADDGYYVTFNAKNLAQDGSEAAVTVAIAVYDEEDTLVDIAFGSARVIGGNSIEVTEEDDISIVSSVETGKVRAFVWWGDTQQPFSTQAELEF